MGPSYDIRTRRDLEFFLAADLAAAGIGRWTISDHLRRPILHCLRILRTVEYLEARPARLSGPALIALKYRLRQTSMRLGFTLPRRVFGPGLSIAHYGTVVVNPRARVGRNCRLHSDVNIGQLHGETCVIGDNVWIGPGAKIYGAIEIGDNVVIGANAVVNRDVPSGVTVAGVPAKVISDQPSTALLRDGCAIAAAQLGYALESVTSQ